MVLWFEFIFSLCFLKLFLLFWFIKSCTRTDNCTKREVAFLFFFLTLLFFVFSVLIIKIIQVQVEHGWIVKKNHNKFVCYFDFLSCCCCWWWWLSYSSRKMRTAVMLNDMIHFFVFLGKHFFIAYITEKN